MSDEVQVGEGAVPIFFDTSYDDFTIDYSALDDLVESSGAKAILMANPCNPTGRILSASELTTLVEICDRRGVFLILDQSFSNIIFDKAVWKSAVIPAFEKLVLIDSFSKNYLMESYLEYHLRAIVTAKGLKILNKYIENNKPKDE